MRMKRLSPRVASPQMCWQVSKGTHNSYDVRAGPPGGHSKQISALAACRARGWHRTCTAPDNALHFTDEAAEARGAKQLAQDCSWLVVELQFRDPRNPHAVTTSVFFFAPFHFLFANQLIKEMITKVNIRFTAAWRLGGGAGWLTVTSPGFHSAALLGRRRGGPLARSDACVTVGARFAGKKKNPGKELA